MSETLRIVLAVVAAGVVGTIANALARALIVGADQFHLLLMPGRYGVAIAVCAALPFLERYLKRGWFWLAAVSVLTIVPSLLAKFVFGAQAGWATVLAYNAVYAVAATATYCVIRGWQPAGATRGA